MNSSIPEVVSHFFAFSIQERLRRIDALWTPDTITGAPLCWSADFRPLQRDSLFGNRHAHDVRTRKRLKIRAPGCLWKSSSASIRLRRGVEPSQSSIVILQSLFG